MYVPNTWVDEILAGAERYDIKEGDGSAYKANMQILLATGVTVPGTSVNAAKLNNLESGVTKAAIILSRQGSSATNWNVGGNTDYVPSVSHLEVGVARFTFTGAVSDISFEVMTNTGWSHPPLIMVGSAGNVVSGSIGADFPSVYYVDYADGTFDIGLKFINGTTPTVTIDVPWTAYGD